MHTLVSLSGQCETVPDIFRTALVRLGGNRWALRVLYYPWRVLPYPLRRLVTAGSIRLTLWVKRVLKVDSQDALTTMNQLGTLSFWGVPEIAVADYRLVIEGEVEQDLSLSLEQLQSLPAVTREVRLDCVGGFRNNSIMEGVSLQALLDISGVGPGARRAVFHCADGYYSSLELNELLDREAFLAYGINGQKIPKFGYPLRLVAPGKYGYQWAKWVRRIELVPDQRKGHWARLGLPDRGDVGDIW